MWNEGITARSLNKTALATALANANEFTWSKLANLAAHEWIVPYHDGINPPLWEYAHIGWFYEWWILREARTENSATAARLPSMLPHADRWFDSAKVTHATRWSLDLPGLNEIRAYRRDVQKRVLEKLSATTENNDALYFFRLGLFHELMHGEALTYMRQTLGHSGQPQWHPRTHENHGEIFVEGGQFKIGLSENEGFAFDNEQQPHEIKLKSFSIDSAPITNRQYLGYIDAGGHAPKHWRKTHQGWEQHWFGHWKPLPLDEPVCHVNAQEAEFFCKWAGRRLPTATEWEIAASQNKIDWGGSVWEWMANAFEPYAGFVAGPYQEYSAPWFGNHREVRGGSFATHAMMHHPRYRNFYLPERKDIFVGFRTCAR